MQKEIIIAGFGGQGVLFGGQVLRMRPWIQAGM